jgi:hypothetical protein
VGDPDKVLRITAGFVALYALALTVVDGAKCEDPSAPGGCRQRIIASNAPALAYLKAQRPEVRLRVVDAVIALESRTAALRKDDDFLCRSGMAGIMAGLERGEGRETRSGNFRNIEVEAPADWMPKFLPPETYRPVQDKVRSELRSGLLKAIE